MILSYGLIFAIMANIYKYEQYYFVKDNNYSLMGISYSIWSMLAIMTINL